MPHMPWFYVIHVNKRLHPTARISFVHIVLRSRRDSKAQWIKWKKEKRIKEEFVRESIDNKVFVEVVMRLKLDIFFFLLLWLDSHRSSHDTLQWSIVQAVNSFVHNINNWIENRFHVSWKIHATVDFLFRTTVNLYTPNTECTRMSDEIFRFMLLI